jgi:hypothetical protein
MIRKESDRLGLRDRGTILSEGGRLGAWGHDRILADLREGETALGGLARLNPNQARDHTHARSSPSMAVHRISLFGAIVIVILAFLLVEVIGFFGLLILILAGLLFWYAFGPGARSTILT